MTLTDAITSASATIGLLKTALAARDEAKIQAALMELQSKYGELGGMVIGLIEKSMSLQDSLVMANNENTQLKLQLAESIKYKLKEIATGAFAYFAEENNETGEPAHYLCQTCKDKGIKAVLRETAKNEWVPRTFNCPNVKEHSFYV